VYCARAGACQGQVMRRYARLHRPTPHGVRIRHAGYGAGPVQYGRVDQREGLFVEQTPVHYAAAGGKCEMTYQLLARGADRSAVCNRGQLPLELVEKEGHLEVTELLKYRPPDSQRSSILWLCAFSVAICPLVVGRPRHVAACC
jgi:hypothetical protein